jgi:hypothetical protein
MPLPHNNKEFFMTIVKLNHQPKYSKPQQKKISTFVKHDARWQEGFNRWGDAL